MSTEPAQDARAPRPRLRAFGLIALVAVGLLLPLETSFRSTQELQPLLLVYGFQVALAACILIAGHHAQGWHAELIARVLVLGHAVALLGYLAVAPEHPGFVANSLTCLLVASAILFSWGGGRTFLVSAFVMVGYLFVGLWVGAHTHDGGRFWIALAGLSIGVTIATTCARVLTEFRVSVARGQDELRALSASLMSAQEEERRRLSRELHDEFGQSLTAVSSYLWLIERQLPEGEGALRTRAAEARRVVARTLGQMRELSQLLCPPVLALYGLIPSLDALCRAFGEQHGIATTLSASDLPERLPSGMETAIYRITQEALTNVARHACAGRVAVHLSVVGSELRLEVDDDGVGIHAREATPGNGLTGIAERVRTLGGTMAVHSGRGTRLLVSMPRPLGEPARAA